MNEHSRWTNQWGQAKSTWKALRSAAEEDRTPRDRASVNALVNRLIADHLAKRKGKGGK